MEEKVNKVKEYQKMLQQIRDIYMFETNEEAAIFIKNYEDEFEKGFIEFVEAI